jgi:glycosyltransferase involved in cell wall biosynthesis
MINASCGVAVIARDEEGVIARCLESLKTQTMSPYIVLVDDGSEDDTLSISSKYADVVVRLPRHEENWTGKPELTRVFNSAFNVLKEKEFEFVMISGADAVYPVNYIEDVIGRMQQNDVVLSSGVAENEPSTNVHPRGCGRIIEAVWFKDLGFKYPENQGFEGYLIYKALSQEEKVAVYPDLKFRLLRRTRTSNKKMYSWGRGMKALNYWWLYAFGRALRYGLTNPMGGYNMLVGYLSDVPQYDDLKGFVSHYQRKMLWKRLFKWL